ncbi:4'-phosphopantetheinyl transferase superfamily protein [Listeria welshimeri]|nr:4'-phosphopantetheinyl transferase superfamily protein [Listeria welshimeri]
MDMRRSPASVLGELIKTSPLIDNLNFQELHKRYWKCISKERKNRIKVYKYENDKIRSIVAEMTLKNALLIKDFKIINGEIEFEQNQFGKLKLKNSKLKFNISHSGDFVIVASSDSEVGIDIEEKKEYYPSILIFFHEIERNFIQNHSNKIELFYDYWCLKESYIKYIGKGLYTSLDSYFVMKESDKYRAYINSTLLDLEFHFIYIDVRYSCAVCTKEKHVDKIEKIELFN